MEAEELLDGPLFLTITETVGRTAGHTDVSLWYVLKGSRFEHLDFDRKEFYGVRWFHRDAVPLERADPELGRFLKKLYGEGRCGSAP